MEPASNNRIDTSTEVRSRIEQALHARRAARGTRRAKIEHGLKTAGTMLWVQVKNRPSLGVVLIGGAGLGLATMVGVGELMIGIAAGYAAFQVLREGVAPGVAVRNVVDELHKLR